MRRLYPDNTFVAPKHADPSHDLVRLAVAEAPGAEEAQVGTPLVGGAGKWFDSILRKAGIDRRGMTLANVLQCRPPDNIFPTDNDARKYISRDDAERAVSHCLEHHLLPLVRSRAWRRIDLFGDKPLRALCGLADGISKWRGSPLKVEGRPAVATFHPAYIMRDQTMFPVAVNDLLKSTEEPPEYYNLYPSLEDVRNFRHKTFAFDIETRGFSKEITMVGLCAEPYKSIVVPFRGPYIAELKRIFSEAEELIGQNIIAFDIPILFEALGLEWK